MSENNKILERAQKLYDEGKWQEAIDLIDTFFASSDEKQIAETNRIKGWCYYYLAIKREEYLKSENLEKAEEYFRLALIKMEKEESIVSILNGLPLVVWILGEEKEAWKISDEAIERFPETSSVRNTRGILCRWAKRFEEAVGVGEKAWEIALKNKDFRTAGHGKHNKADALVQLGMTEEAKMEYQKAIQLYKEYQQISGQNMKFHLESVRKKLSSL